jgi:hypothetical protein
MAGVPTSETGSTLAPTEINLMGRADFFREASSRSAIQEFHALCENRRLMKCSQGNANWREQR